MEENRIAYRRYLILGGIIMSGLLIILSQLVNTFEVKNGTLKILITVLIIIATIIYFSNQYVKSAREPIFPYSKAFGYGVLMGLPGAFLFGIYTYLFYKFSHPGKIEEIIVLMEEQMLETGQKAEKVERMSALLDKVLTPFVLAIVSFLNYFILALLLSLFAAIFTRDRESSNPFTRDEMKTNGNA